jgi:hypothetical protein
LLPDVFGRDRLHVAGVFLDRYSERRERGGANDLDGRQPHGICGIGRRLLSRHWRDGEKENQGCQQSGDLMSADRTFFYTGQGLV